MRRDGSTFSRYANSVITLLAFSPFARRRIDLDHCCPAAAALRMRELGAKDWRGSNGGLL